MEGTSGEIPTHLAKLAKQYLGAQATSVASERVFSNAGAIVNSKRSLLDPENVSMLLSLKKFCKGDNDN